MTEPTKVLIMRDIYRRIFLRDSDREYLMRGVTDEDYLESPQVKSITIPPNK
jgi:hypothetical protein